MSLILIADDQLSIREGFGMILKQEGYQTILVKNGVDALAALKEASIDLILSDGRMPQMTGFELLRIIRATPAYTHMPFILASGEVAADILQKSRARPYIYKFG